MFLLFPLSIYLVYYEVLIFQNLFNFSLGDILAGFFSRDKKVIFGYFNLTICCSRTQKLSQIRAREQKKANQLIQYLLCHVKDSCQKENAFIFENETKF